MSKKIITIITFCFLSFFTFAQETKKAPDFEFQMVDGSKKKLSDFQGKVVYLSFWASWCKPCIVGFEKYESIRKEMEALGVVLLNISIDADSEKWSQAMQTYNIAGSHALVNKQDVQELYELYSVPVYEIIGKQGQFLYLSDDPERSVLDEFQRFINQD